MRNVLIRFAAIFAVSLFSHAVWAATAVSRAPAGDYWFERCNEGYDAAKPKKGQCEVFQRLTETKNNQRVAEFAVGFPADKTSARGVVSLPLGILLQQPMQIRIDDQPPFAFKLRYCDPAGCYAYLNLEEPVLEKLRKGEKLTISFESARPQKVEIVLSLKGFSKALKDISG